MDGFDAEDTMAKWVFTTTFTSGAGLAPVFTSSTRFGTGFAVTNTSITPPSTSVIRITKSFTASSQIFVGAAIKSPIQASQTFSTPFHVLLGDTATTAHLYLVNTTAGAIRLYRGDGTTVSFVTTFTPGGTLLATSAAGVMDANWHYVEMSATLNATTGTVVVKVDGTQVISFTGNTKNGGTSTNIDAVIYQDMAWGATTIDDLYICNSAGSAPTNTFLGDCRVQTCMPNGAGTSTQFTPTGSGTNYLNVNDVPDSTSTFNSDSTPGHRDTYAMANLASGTGTVFAVQQVMSALKTGAGSASLKAAQLSGATVSYGATRSLGTAAAAYADVFETNPATSATWTVADVNGLEAGAEVV